MLTPKEVEEQAFPKAKKGGYQMDDVDSFLDQLTTDYSELYKENAVLKRKMKVLADKITEYQETEGAMRATLLSAQKMADQIVEEAKTKRAKMLDEAETTAKQRKDELAAEIAQEEGRLEAAKASVASMTSSIAELVAHEQEFLDKLPKLQVTSTSKASRTARVQPAVQEIPEDEDEDEADAAADDAAADEDDADDADDDIADEIGDSISRMLAEAARGMGDDDEEDEEEDEDEDEPEEEAPRRVSRRYSEPDPDDDTPTRRIDLSELRFGRNYEIK